MKIFVIFILVYLIIGAQCLDGDTATMAVEYFSLKKVKQICSITCSSDRWLRDLSVLASKADISVSAVSPLKSWRFIKRCLRQQYVPVGIILNVGCHGAQGVLVKSSEERNFDAMHNWIILEFAAIIFNYSAFNYSENGIRHNHVNEEYKVRQIKLNSTTETLLQSLNISIDAEITWCVHSSIGGGYDLFDVFNFGRIQGGILRQTPLGRWTKSNGLLINVTGYKYQRRWDFHNLTLRAISVMLVSPKVFSPNLITGREYTPGVSAMTKISSMVLDLFREKHNFRFNYTITDRWVGAPEKNSTLAVTNSMLWREQDISSTCLRIFPAWLNGMDAFFPHTTYLETKFYYRIPVDGVGKLENKFLRPFSGGVWVCVFCTIALSMAALFAAARVETRPKPAQYAVFSVIAAFCQQMFTDGPDPVRTTASSGQGRKAAMLITGVSSLLLYNYYTSSVVSWLLSASVPSISSLDELISSSLEVVFEDIGYTRSWLEVPGYYYGRNRSPKEDVLREKKVKIVKRQKPVLQSIDDGIELVRSGGYAYHTEPYNANMRIGRTFGENELCDLGSLQMMERAPVYIVGQRNSPYREFFVWSMMRALERGHVSCARRRVRVAEPRCGGSTPRALALGGAAPAFLLLAVCGWGAAILTLLVEILMEIRKKYKQHILQLCYSQCRGRIKKSARPK